MNSAGLAVLRYFQTSMKYKPTALVQSRRSSTSAAEPWWMGSACFATLPFWIWWSLLKILKSCIKICKYDQIDQKVLNMFTSMWGGTGGEQPLLEIGCWWCSFHTVAQSTLLIFSNLRRKVGRYACVCMCVCICTLIFLHAKNGLFRSAAGCASNTGIDILCDSSCPI